MKIIKVLFLVVATISSDALSRAHYNKVVDQVQIDSSSGCLLFSLEGVTEADPVKPNGPWFSMHPDNASKQAVLSVLLLSHASGSQVKVTTTGGTQCGHAEFHTVRLQSKS
ncbi:hypothetical protein F0267_23135 [Vibrio coralliilyticus]|uniref:Uncharacterized protein n=1 Tax=Vibrio coralliilyticus TaxID=190893 RepID=A0AAN0SAF2_9VIBR|nr:hypothetical protein [Vibrio coralliilyticus]AIW18809.1 hypothetical protein IX92_07015 [Vibrio coralliilyticus]NOH41126.1 hypothetical protein [Vibrio coralliilyticus]